MRRANIIEKDITSIGTLKNLTNVFESLASNQVAKVKHRAGLGHEFFQMIWNITPLSALIQKNVCSTDQKRIVEPFLFLFQQRLVCLGI